MFSWKRRFKEEWMQLLLLLSLLRPDRRTDLEYVGTAIQLAADNWNATSRNNISDVERRNNWHALAPIRRVNSDVSYNISDTELRENWHASGANDILSDDEHRENWYTSDLIGRVNSDANCLRNKHRVIKHCGNWRTSGAIRPHNVCDVQHRQNWQTADAFERVNYDVGYLENERYNNESRANWDASDANDTSDTDDGENHICNFKYRYDISHYGKRRLNCDVPHITAGYLLLEDVDAGPKTSDADGDESSDDNAGGVDFANGETESEKTSEEDLNLIESLWKSDEDSHSSLNNFEDSNGIYSEGPSSKICPSVPPEQPDDPSKTIIPLLGNPSEACATNYTSIFENDIDSVLSNDFEPSEPSRTVASFDHGPSKPFVLPNDFEPSDPSRVVAACDHSPSKPYVLPNNFEPSDPSQIVTPLDHDPSKPLVPSNFSSLFEEINSLSDGFFGSDVDPTLALNLDDSWIENFTSDDIEDDNDGLAQLESNVVEHPEEDDFLSVAATQLELSLQDALTDFDEANQQQDIVDFTSAEDFGIVGHILDDRERDELYYGMLHAPPPPPVAADFHHSRPFQGRNMTPYMRSLSMEPRWHDFNLMNFPPSAELPQPPSSHHHHHHHHYPPAANYPGSTPPIYPPPPPHEMHPSRTTLMLHNSSTNGAEHHNQYASLTGGGSNCPMSSTNVDSCPVPPSIVQFKGENASHSASYNYSNVCSGMNAPTNGENLLPSFLDEDLQLMDMAINTEGYSLRMLDNHNNNNNGTNNNNSIIRASAHGQTTCIERCADSDSAVSSMGSERVPSLSSDNEWMETNSDSGNGTTEQYTTEYDKYKWCDPYGNRSLIENPMGRYPQAPQKKYQFYGKGTIFQDQDKKPLIFQDQYVTNLRSVQDITHNHTYANMHPNVGHVPIITQHLADPSETKIKGKSKSSIKSESEQLTKDEKRARDHNIPISVHDIINLPMDEFNERLTKYELDDVQHSLIRDIRRRGKNKVAAQNCRKRKLDQIMCLADEVQEMKARKQRIMDQREFYIREKYRMTLKFEQLYNHVFQSLRDRDGNPYSQFDFVIDTVSSNGSMGLVQRRSPLNPYLTNMSGHPAVLKNHQIKTEP